MTITASVIDKLKFVARLEDSGFQRRQAEGLAHALDDALGERVLTRADLDEALHPIEVQLVEFNAKFDAIDAKFDAVEEKFVATDAKLSAGFDALNSKLDASVAALNGRIDTLAGKVDANFATLSTRIDALASNLRVVTVVMLFGFTLLAGLGLYNAAQLRPANNPVAAPAPQHQEPAPAPVPMPR